MSLSTPSPITTFTKRQARFLVLVMRHAGLCVKRQYAAFAGIANGGERCNAFFDKLVSRGFPTRVECIHNRAYVMRQLCRSARGIASDHVKRLRTRRVAISDVD
jgi:hypothetical protein